MPALLKIILYPFSILYKGITSVRNYLYDKGIFKSTEFDIPVVGVGNLAVGGTGKTPMVEYLVEMLKDELRIATLSRGYGRKTRGFRMAGEQDSAQTIGDEPFQLYKKFKENIFVSVGEERVLAIPRLLYSQPATQVVILDDAFQHRAIRPSLQILITSYAKPFYNDLEMPSGTLRESRRGARRADVVVVTKCPPGMRQKEMDVVRNKILSYAGAKKVFFSKLSYDEPVWMAGDKPEKITGVVLVTGIADDKPLVKEVAEKYNLVKHYSFSDHHSYRNYDIEKIGRFIAGKTPGAIVMTTEKDAVKINPLLEKATFPLYVLPVKMEFLNNKDIFEEIVRRAVKYKEV